MRLKSFLWWGIHVVAIVLLLANLFINEAAIGAIMQNSELLRVQNRQLSSLAQIPCDPNSVIR